ncbi:hypothetical protein LJC34_01720 [Oscillospiraceae bacterium OttesenSCG-928-G22]|nr:hypothetical protein [Oscillospiraceae bacterium OttesenSCG-928-G22]
MKKPDDFRLEPTDDMLNSLARRLYPAIRDYFESEEGRRDFEAWKKEKAALEGEPSDPDKISP